MSGIQHTHPDGIGLKSTALDRLYTQGYRATRVITRRYQELISGYLERSTPHGAVGAVPPVCILPVDFSPDPKEEPC